MCTKKDYKYMKKTEALHTKNIFGSQFEYIAIGAMCMYHHIMPFVLVKTR